ncbi:MAG: gamma-glutamylcyclotransferase family protein [Candidatus Bathyarchaeia archaeon]|jgi:gamma-glutamylcyclotransferase (GGCT)/AIG2-like uncharacterized protein YtfP
MTLVWQYGSNMDEERINDPDRLKGTAKFVGLAVKRRHKLAFTHTNLDGVGTADIVEAGICDYVIGCLYEIPDEMLKQLDKVEGVNSGAYKRVNVDVKRLNEKFSVVSESLIPISYVVVNKEKRAKTDAEYSNHILQGVITHRMGRSYFERIKKIIIKNNPSIQKELLSYSPC